MAAWILFAMLAFLVLGVPLIDELYGCAFAAKPIKRRKWRMDRQVSCPAKTRKLSSTDARARLR
jgi:hypothetical protein